MFIESIVNALFSEKNYKKIKLAYRKFRKRILPKISEKQFRKILREQLFLRKGAVVFVHSSITNLNIDFTPSDLLNILLDEVGEKGTILMPCNQLKVRAEEYLNSGAVFNVKRTPTVMGLLPELARRHRNAVRSLHPTHSVVAVGKYAKELTQSHHLSVYPFGECSPYYKIVEYNGIILGLGLETGQCLSFVHCSEDTLKGKFPVKTLLDKVYIGEVLDYGGNQINVETLVPNPNAGKRNITAYIRKHIPNDICKDINKRGVKYFFADAKALLNKMNENALKGVTIYGETLPNREYPL